MHKHTHTNRHQHTHTQTQNTLLIVHTKTRARARLFSSVFARAPCDGLPDDDDDVSGRRRIGRPGGGVARVPRRRQRIGSKIGEGKNSPLIIVTSSSHVFVDHNDDFYVCPSELAERQINSAHCRRRRCRRRVARLSALSRSRAAHTTARGATERERERKRKRSEFGRMC